MSKVTGFKPQGSRSMPANAKTEVGTDEFDGMLQKTHRNLYLQVLVSLRKLEYTDGRIPLVIDIHQLYIYA